MCRSLQATLLVFALLASDAIASSSLSVEINKLVEALGWPEMIRIGLKRGDLQKSAKAKLPGPDKAACIDGKYTEKRVLSEIVAGYAEVYKDPAIVAETTKFMSSPGAKKILAAVASRAPAVGAKAAYEENKSSAWDSLTPEEQDRFTTFFNSAAGKAYFEVRPKQTEVHQRRLARLAADVVEQCSQ